MSSITLIVNEVKRRAEALTCNNVAGKPEGRNGNNKTVSAISRPYSQLMFSLRFVFAQSVKYESINT